MRILPKIFLFKIFPLFLIPYFFSLILFASPALAYPGGGPAEFQAAIDNSKYNQQSWGLETFKNFCFSIISAIFGGTTPEAAKRANGGAAGFIASGIDYMYQNPAASGMQYFADIGSKLNLVPPVYAQGQGFRRIIDVGVLDIWRGFRNAGYVVFVVMFVALGLAIMFRVNLNPQTVINIQSAIPRVIIALLLVTFSFAITGLLLDVARLLTNLVDAVFNVIGVDWPRTIGNIAGSLFTGATIVAVFVGLLAILGPVGGAGAAFMGAAIGIVAVFAILRLFFTLLMAYIGILLRLIMAPFYILFDALPGRSFVGGWLMGMVAEISVFVTAYVIWRLGWAIFAALGPGVSGLVPLPPGFGIIELLKGLFMLGIILMIPNITEAVKEQIKRGFQVGEIAGRDLATTAFREGQVYRVIQPGVKGAVPWQTRVGRAIYMGLGGRQAW